MDDVTIMSQNNHADDSGTVAIGTHAENAYLAYALAVVKGRALPSVEDGQKPVQRRILFAMKEMGLVAGVKPVKSARVVGECFVAGTLVSTPSGLKEIENLSVNDQVFTELGVGTVSGLFEMPVKPLLAIRLSNGMENVVTHQQLIRVINQDLSLSWKQADQLKDDYVVVKPTRLKDFNNCENFIIGKYLDREIVLDNKISYLIGQLVSDGHISSNYGHKNNNRVEFFSAEIDIADRIKLYLKDIFEYESNIEKINTNGICRDGSAYKTVYKVRINNLELSKFILQTFKLMPRVKSNLKFIPNNITTSGNRGVLTSLLSGFIDGDGSISDTNRTIHIGSTSHEMVKNIQSILTMLGYQFSTYVDSKLINPYFLNKVGDGDVVVRHVKRNFDYHYIEVRSDEAMRLASELNLSHRNKAARCLSLTKEIKNKKQNNNDIIPNAGKVIFEDLSSKHLGGGWYKKPDGSNFRAGIKYLTGKKIKYSSNLKEKPLRLSQIIDFGILNKLDAIGSSISDRIRYIEKNGLRFVKVLSVTAAEPEKTYDIQVKEHHNFIANGMVVHNCMGKFHPHGDSSTYEASVRLAQDFTLRYPLIDGQGNFGSRDGDNAAAMRYTEMRLSPIADLLLSEIDRGTVDFKSNYDGAFQEPVMLPARLPMLLLNGASGIAVGMATEMVPHNLREIAHAALHLMDDAEATTEAILKIVPGPDFPGGGQLISQPADILSTYETGRGSLRLRARWSIEQLARGQWRIVINELPHGVSVETVMAEIDAISNPKPKKDKKAIDQDQLLIKQSVLSMLDSVKSEGKKEVKLILEPKTSKIPSEELMAFLLLHTSMEVSCPVNMVMIGTDGKPGQKGLVQILKEWIAFRVHSVKRRCQFDVDKIDRRIHILEGRLIAFLHIDEIIKVIRNSDDPKADLITSFNLSDIQAEDILEIRLRQLARLEGFKIEKELKDLREEADGLNSILGSEHKLRKLTAKEIKQDAEKYGDDRRTLIEAVERTQGGQKAFVVDEPVTIILSRNGWIRSRQGHNIDHTSILWKAGDSEFAIIETRSVLPVILIDTNGRAYAFDASSVPGGKGDGLPVTSIIELQNGGKLVHALSGNGEDKYLFSTNNGYGFIAPLKGLVARPKAGKVFMKPENASLILKPVIVNQHTHLAVTSSENKLLMFELSEINEYPNGGKGVTLIDLPDNAAIINLELNNGLSATVTLKNGKKKEISGDPLIKYQLKRARKGCLIEMTGGTERQTKMRF